MAAVTYTRRDLAHSPMVAFFEMTRACDLACVHCRADAQHAWDPHELSTRQVFLLVDQMLRFPRPPLLVLTGGDPLKRADAFDVVAYAVRRGLVTAMTPSATPLVTSEAIARLKQCGLHRLAVSLDGADAATHDDFRGVAKSYARTLEIIHAAQHSGLPMQINTTLGRHNMHQLRALVEGIAELKPALWSVFFVVPTGRANAALRLSAEECERAFEELWERTRAAGIVMKTTEAPHYRRYILQRQASERRSGAVANPRLMPMVGTNDGKGVVFISHTGEICPSGFLPIVCGRFPLDSVVKVYQNAALFHALRDSRRLRGKCGRCEYREVCGGSRARSYAMTGDPLAEEPDCVFIPQSGRTEN